MTTKNIILSAIMGIGFVANAVTAEPTEIERYAHYEGVLDVGATQTPSKPSSIDILQFADYEVTHVALISATQPRPDRYAVVMRDDERKSGPLPWPLSEQS